MKKNLQKLFICIFLSLACVQITYAQGKISGKVIDEITKEGLPGASVTIAGTTIGTTTDVDGNFTLDVNTASAKIAINYIGYKVKELTVSVSKNKSLGDIALTSETTSMSEIIVTASSTAIDRKTPIAVSSISAEYIAEKGSSQEFPELLKATPGVYATRAGGGYGDSRINLRGFQSANVAVLINGVPVNDMQNGRVFWSNWAGLTDVTRSTQVQRGLGASKVAVPSIGGTINILTKTTDVNQGGTFFQGIGNNEYSKTSFSYSSGLSSKGWAFSVLGAKNTGNGFANGLNYEAYSYFFNVSKIINAKHSLSLTGFGAPQVHAQRFDRLTIQDYQNAPQGIRYNPNWGSQDGAFKSMSVNRYHKPQVSLNHNWTIDNTSFLTTAVYASYGKGGVTFDTGSINFDEQKNGNRYSPVNFDQIVDQNESSVDGRALGFLQTQSNNHDWFGLLSTYSKKLNDNFDLLAGADIRYYNGSNFTSVGDLIGADYVLATYTGSNPFNSNGNINDQNYRAQVGDKINFNSESQVNWQGGFLQLEYDKEKLSAFISTSASNTSYQRTDFFKYLDSDPAQVSDKVNFFGYQAKGGANYRITSKHNVFANIGYFTKAPFFNAAFLNNQNTINPDAVNEKIMSYELGYGFRTNSFDVNLNAYSTRWNDRSFTRSFQGQTPGSRYFANLVGVDALHNGLELEFFYRTTSKLSIRGSASVGDWKWKNNLDQITVQDENQVNVGTVGPIFMSGIKVGDAPQTTFALGADYKILGDLKLGVNYNFSGDYNSDFDPTTLLTPGLVPYKVPNYSLFDVNASFKFKFSGLSATFYANVLNVFDTEYLSDGFARFDSSGISNASNAFVYYGTGRTWTSGIKINF
jgi:iron complex outermembrane receptor protein